MIVAQLIQKLESLPQTLEVFIDCSSPHSEMFLFRPVQSVDEGNMEEDEQTVCLLLSFDSSEDLSTQLPQN